MTIDIVKYSLAQENQSQIRRPLYGQSIIYSDIVYNIIGTRVLRVRDTNTNKYENTSRYKCYKL